MEPWATVWLHGSAVEPWATVWLHGSAVEPWATVWPTVPRLNRGTVGHGLAPRLNLGTVGHGLAPRFHGSTVEPWEPRNRGGGQPYGHGLPVHGPVRRSPPHSTVVKHVKRLLVQKAYHVATVALASMSMSNCCKAIVGAESVTCRNCGT